MTDLPEHLEDLERALAALGDEVLPLSELDGLLAAVSACPEPIPPEEWLPLIWTGEDLDEEALLNSGAPVEAVGRILARQQEITAALAQGSGAFEPVFSVDESGEVLWEVWLEGFLGGMALRPDAWEALHARGGAGAEAFELLTTYVALAEGDPQAKAELGPRALRQLLSTAPDVLPECVEVIAQAAHASPREPVRSAKVGRNEPCPCGSGKKFKKCCGAE